MESIKNTYHLFADPLHYYNQMIIDIENATKSIYIETFKFGKDEIGERFLIALNKKAKQGIEIKILIDYWGAGSANHDYFKKLTDNGGEVRFFEKIKFNSDFFTRSHRRNHRKLLLIDNQITYIGSSNITGYNLNWRESVLRIVSDITPVLTKVFFQDFNNYNKYTFHLPAKAKLIKHGNFEIVRDIPSIARKQINSKFIKLIKNAKSQITIATPYFLPGFFLRKALVDAAQRGVSVNIIMPKHSDVSLIDILRNKYFGVYYKAGINILFYEINNLHAKMMIVDKKIFAIGSSNFDYRSYRYMYEIMLIGNNRDIAKQVNAHMKTSINNSVKFDYHNWKNRSQINKLFEWILLPFRHLL